jgi:hypothetical protein
MKIQIKHASSRNFLAGAFALTAVFSLGSPFLTAQEPANPPNVNAAQTPVNGGVISTESRIVLVDAVVTDKKGK